MVHRLWFNGRCCREFGIYVSGSGSYNAPEKDIELLDIPGRNGSLLVSRNRFKNVVITYPAFIRTAFTKNAEAARSWLLSPPGYCKLEDDYSLQTFRMAYFAGPIDFDMRFLNRSGETNLAFNCKPQRFLKSGQFSIEWVSGQKIANQWQTSLPLFEISGNGAGQLVVGDVVVDISNIDQGLFLDAENQNAYYGTLNKNNTIKITGGEFPVLPHGESMVAWSGGITSVKITPKWWTL